jgi:hypothetical protein
MKERINGITEKTETGAGTSRIVGNLPTMFRRVMVPKGGFDR